MNNASKRDPDPNGLAWIGEVLGQLALVLVIVIREIAAGIYGLFKSLSGK